MRQHGKVVEVSLILKNQQAIMK